MTDSGTTANLADKSAALRLLMLTLLLTSAGFLALPYDDVVSLAIVRPTALHHPAARAIAVEENGDRIPGDLRRLAALSEVFAHGMGVAAIVLLIFLLDPDGRSRLPFILACAALPGMSAVLLKGMIVRMRPMYFDFQSDALTTFRDGAQLLTSNHRWQSTPSGHAATAVGLAVALAIAYPRGRWLFGMFALLAGLQRIESGAHFLSDVLWGGAIGALICAVVIALRRFVRPVLHAASAAEEGEVRNEAMTRSPQDWSSI